MMPSSSLLLLNHRDVAQLLKYQENKVLTAVAHAYQAHAKQACVMPPNAYLRFPNSEKKKRILAKPAYLGDDFEVAGIKWSASFPENRARGLERASATLILNSMETGWPTAIMESTLLGIERTAASAALAAQHLWSQDSLSAFGIIGCGTINLATLRFLKVVYPMLTQVHIYNRSTERALWFQEQVALAHPELQVSIADSPATVLDAAAVISLATSAVEPHITHLGSPGKPRFLLHLSSYDLSPELILAANNIVDDREHMCAQQTSLHLAEQQVGHCDFIQATIGEWLLNDMQHSTLEQSLTIFSPFGLGVLDLAVAQLLVQLAAEQDVGTTIQDFICA